MLRRTGLVLLAGIAPVGLVPLCMLTVGAAMAQDHPLDVPTRDVTATYQLQGGPPGARAQTMRMWYDVNGDKMRIGQASMGYTIMDGAARRTYVVNIPQRSYFEVPFDPAERSFMPPGMRFARGGTATVAGLPCTVWTATARGQTSSACITSDGLMLSAQETGPGGQTQRIVAASVTYGPQPASLFQPPAGYRRVQAPPMPGGPPGQR